MKSGVVTLYMGSEVISYHRYDGVPERKAIIEKWYKIYSAGIKKCAIHIEPDFNDEFYDENGKVMNWRKQRKNRQPTYEI